MNKQAFGHSLAGTWIVSFAPQTRPGTVAPKIMNVATFTTDGLMIAAGTSRVLSIPPLSSLGDENGVAGGEWIRLGKRSFRYTHVSVIYKNGVPGGVQTESVSVTLSETDDKFSGVSKVEFRDMNQNIVFAGQASASAIRLALDSVGIPTGPLRTENK